MQNSKLFLCQWNKSRISVHLFLFFLLAFGSRNLFNLVNEETASGGFDSEAEKKNAFGEIIYEIYWICSHY